MIIGAQLYTVRNACKTLEDLEATLEKVAKMGYRAVQLSGVCEYTPEWISEKLEKYGLRADLTHYNYKSVLCDTEATIAFHDAFGCKYIGIGSIPGFKKNGAKQEDFDEFLRLAVPAAKKIAASGHKLMYHNHDMEFAKPDGRNYLEKLCDALNAEECGITLDTYWVQAGGADPVDWINRLHGRLNCVHFKDMVWNAQDMAVRMAPVGSGSMNFPAIIEACKAAEVEFAYVEQDKSYEEDPFDCLKKSFDYLNGFDL